MEGFLFALTLITALGCGLNAGIFFTFSSFVMAALARLQPARGNEAMQSINVVAVTPAFMTALFGTAAACAVLAVWGIFTLDESYGIYLLLAGAVYLFGTIGLTIGYHVPRNNALAATDPDSSEGASYWSRYLAEWTRLNHVRAAAAFVAAALLTIALTV
ncbi:MAG: DUF1772 domain-containing protein [Solirubrobacterales bacterium]